MPIKLLPWLKPALLLLLLLALLAWAYRSGYSKRDWMAKTEMAGVVQRHQQAQFAAAETYSRHLAQVQKQAQQWQSQADKVTLDLATANQQARHAAAVNQKGIDYALAQDKTVLGECIDGFGADGLRQYTHSLGYTE